IHRDIKPGNLLWGSDSVIKLTDFGIARLFGNTGLTSEGGVLGTAEYMAPEQADGRRVTHHCDLYSLGGVLYALLAGRPPFQAKSMLEMLQMQRYSQPEPVRRYAHEAPAELERIISQ
ncbi:MAG: protein kinase, partial [Planctomycetales bacterium]|nr:protein kinase [Planctomycetales bacterium]